jgi:hypothetical protein
MKPEGHHLFKISFVKGDVFFKPFIEMEWRWFGTCHWMVWFLPFF